MLFLSPRNSLEGQLHIVDSVNCKIFVSPSIDSPTVASIVGARNLRHFVVPELEDWLTGPPPQPRQFNKIFEEVRHEPLVVLHSSGTTALPKPIGYTHGCLAAVLSQLDYAVDGQQTLTQCAVSSRRLFIGFPLFHAGGLFFPLALAVFAGIQIVFPPVGQPLNADLAHLIHLHSDARSSCLPPAIIEDLSKGSAFLGGMKKLQFIITGGAPLPKSVGDTIQSAGPRIYNMLASTETGVIPALDLERDDWQYIRFAPSFGIELRPHSDDLHELVIVRESTLEGRQGIFENFPAYREYSTQDLFRRHPDPRKSDYWLSCGRFDDVVVLLNGEKFNPIAMEKHIQGHPAISSALVSGRDRIQPALLIELRGSALVRSNSDKLEMIEQLWPVIEQANKHGPAHGRLAKSFITFTTPEKPMIRTPKGSVNRNSTLELYADEIDALYHIKESHTAENGPKYPESSCMTSASLKELIRQVTGLPISSLNNDDDLFAFGMDSLHVLHLAHNINAVIGDGQVGPGLIYKHPTVAKLLEALQPSTNGSRTSLKDGAFNASNMFERYTLDMPIAKYQRAKVAILTGSTGGLGSYLLKALVRSGFFAKIYCLVRSLPASTSKSRSNVIYLKCDFSDPQLGLGYDIYSDLLENVTHILHNAWQVDFNLSLETFDLHVRGVRHFIDFSARSKHNAHIFFISSIAAVLNAPSDPIPEDIYEDDKVAQPIGYGQSKHIAERLLHYAGTKSHISSSICRIGQVAGPVHEDGMWNKREWLPSLIASSKHLGYIPSSLGSANEINWIPVDILAQIITELFLDSDIHSSSSPTTTRITQIFHLTNPSSITWDVLLPIIQTHLSETQNQNQNLPTTRLQTWVQHLQASAANLQNLTNNPAVRLLDFYESISRENAPKFPKLDITNAKQRSPTLAALGPVRGDWMKLWLRQWGFEVREGEVR